MKIKFNKYLEAGVKEYWIVDPESRTVAVNLLERKEYKTQMYGEEDMAPTGVLNGFEIDLGRVFEDK
jgi:Uma2 family endonuclease